MGEAWRIAQQILLGILATIGITFIFNPIIWYSPYWLNLKNLGFYPLTNDSLLINILLTVSLLLGEAVLHLPQRILERQRGLVLGPLVLFGVVFTTINSFHHFLNIHTFISSWFWLIALFYLVRYQRRFIAEGTYYDLLLGLVYVWPPLMQEVMHECSQMINPATKINIIAPLFVQFIVPLMLVYPGVFPQEKMRMPVFISIGFIPISISCICDHHLMSLVVAHTYSGLPFFWAVYLFSFIIYCVFIFCVLGRVVDLFLRIGYRVYARVRNSLVPRVHV